MGAKFDFPSKGFHLVADKVAESDYFLRKMKELKQDLSEYRFVFSAFVSASRSITFAMQSVMSAYPGFEDWYGPRQQRLKESDLAQFFVRMRNHLQKAGSAPLYSYGWSQVEGGSFWTTGFVPSLEFAAIPEGDVTDLCEDYFLLLLQIVRECYVDFWAYVDPTALFTLEGLDVLGWSVEDVEECVGFPRGYTDIPWHDKLPWPQQDHELERLRALSRHGGDELLEAFFIDYGIQSAPDAAGAEV